MPIAGSVDTADAIHCKIFNLDFFQNVQFLTIRRYLMLMFSALIVLLLIAAVWF